MAAHLEALIADPEAQPRRTEKVHLPVSDGAGPRCLAVELGLSRVEGYLEPDQSLRLETAGDAFLLHTRETARRKLMIDELGMRFSRSRGAFTSTLPIATKKQRLAACRHVQRMLVELLELGSGQHYSVALERRLKPDNAHLVDQIRTLVRKRDLESRRVVYQSIVGGRFYLPVSLGDSEAELPMPPPFEEPLGGRPVWAVFSDEQSLKHTKEVASIVISGVRLIQAAHVHELGGIKLNPGAQYGGELYAHELQSLGDYLRRLGMMEVVQPKSSMAH